ncbi:hypothetical protein DICA1_B15016 [Diutina catenulata]
MLAPFFLLSATVVAANIYYDLDVSTYLGMTYPELTIDPKTDEDYQSGGFWEGDSYTLTGDPEDFNLHAGVQEKDFYSIVYSEFEGKVPLESFVVPGGIILGCDYEGQTIESNFYYTVNPETYRARLAYTFDGISFDRLKYISKYEHLYTEHSGLIPITAIDGARACMDYEGIDPWYYDDVSEMRASAESEYTSYMHEMSVSRTVGDIKIVNGVSLTAYFDENYDTVPTTGPGVARTDSETVAVTSLSSKEKVSFQASQETTSSDSVPSVVAQSEPMSPVHSKSNTSQPLGSSALHSSIPPVVSETSTDSAGLLSPLSSLLVLAVVLI